MKGRGFDHRHPHYFIGNLLPIKLILKNLPIVNITNFQQYILLKNYIMNSLDYAETICKVCERGNNPDKMLLCDSCDDGFHIYCLNIPQIPATDWHCPMCQFGRTSVSSSSSSSSSSNFTSEPKELLAVGTEAVVYIRVSSKGQDQPEYGRVGLDTQTRIILDFVAQKNLRMTGMFTDTGSGRDTTKLSGFNSMMKSIKNGTAIIVYNVTRFGRESQIANSQLIELHKKNCYVYSVSENVSSHDSRFKVFLEQAEHEANKLSKTIKDSIARRKAQGAHIGKAPYGFIAYHDNAGIRRIKEYDPEQLIIEKMVNVWNLYNDIEKVLDYLWDNDLKNRNGNEFTAGIVKGILEKEGITFSRKRKNDEDMNDAPVPEEPRVLPARSDHTRFTRYRTRSCSR